MLHITHYLPMFRVISRYTETNLGAHFKSSILGEENDIGGLEGVFGGQENAAVVDASFEIRASGS